MARLTKRSVEAAKAEGEGWSWVGDDEVPGFGVRVHASGTKTFHLRYRTQGGRQRMLKLGRFGELTVQKARDLARKEKSRVLEGGDPKQERQREATGIRTVGRLMDRWVEEYAKAHRKGWEEDKRRVDARIRPALGRVALTDLSTDRLTSWHRKIGGGSPVEANRCIETLRAAWRWADRQGLLPDGVQDPTGRVKRFREKGRDRWLRREELERLIEATDQEAGPYVRAAVRLLLMTGLRKNELLSARWTNVDLERGEILLPETKSGAAQTRLLPSPAVQILRELPRYQRNPYVFPSPVKRGAHRLDFKAQWSRIRERADLDDVTLHDLRRTAGSFMAQSGVPLQVIQHVLGHSHPGVTKLYARIASENERDALETLADSLGELLATPGQRPENVTAPNVPPAASIPARLSVGFGRSQGRSRRAADAALQPRFRSDPTAVERGSPPSERHGRSSASGPAFR
jgi:integrase